MKLDRVPRPAQFALLVVVSGLIVAVGVATRLGGPDAEAAVDAAAATAAALCDATAQARDDPEEARTTFTNRAHEGVHDLARRVQPDHPGLVSRILEAKFRVEEDIAQAAPAGRLHEHLAQLTTAVNQALEQLSLSAACAPDPTA